MPDVAVAYANYGSRAAAYLIDFLILWGIAITSGVVGLALLFSEPVRAIGIILLVAAVIWIPSVSIMIFLGFTRSSPLPRNCSLSIPPTTG